MTLQYKMISVLFLIEFGFLVPFVIFLLPFTGIHGWSTNHYYHQYRYQSLPFTRQNYNEYITFSGTNLSRNKIQDRRQLTHLQLSTIDESTTDDMIQIVHQPKSNFLSSKGVFDWPTWGCSESKFPWSYSYTEVCYLIKGKVIITPVI